MKRATIIPELYNARIIAACPGSQPPPRGLALGAGLSALLLAACSSGLPCFNQSSLVIDTRILAMRADPPEQYVDLSGETPLQPIEIRALVVEPGYLSHLEYGRAVEHDAFPATFTLCLPPLVSDINASPDCPAGSAPVAQLGAVPAHDAPLVLTPPLALLQQAAARDPLGGRAGLTLRLQMSLDLGGAGTALATKDLSFQLAGSPATLNHALELIGIEQSDDGAHRLPAIGQPLSMKVGQTTGLRPLIGPGAGATSAVETYSAYDNDGVLAQFTEHVTYAFYDGNALFFGTPHNGEEAIYTGAPGDVADEPPAGSPDPPDGLATAEPVFPGSQGGSFWVVARDGRGGVAWASYDWTAVDLRGCGDSCPTLFFGCN